jgi:hypothetical protein
VNRLQRQLLSALGAGLLSVACSGSEEPEAAPKPVLSVFDHRPAAEGAKEARVEIGQTSRAPARTADQNQRPQIRIVSMEPSSEAGGGASDAAIWRASVLAEDPDGDDLEIEYRWFVNGVETDVEDKFYPTDKLKRGDRIKLSARVFDGKLWSGSIRSREVEIGNIHPTIVSVPPRPAANGHFRYRVDVNDTGANEKLRFSLRKSPRGMQIGELSGEVTWQPGSDQAGRHEVEIVVRDEDGGEASQAFSLALVSMNDSEEMPPASPR